MRLMRIGPVGAERPVLLDGDEALDASSVVMDFDRTWWTDGGPGSGSVLPWPDPAKSSASG